VYGHILLWPFLLLGLQADTDMRERHRRISFVFWNFFTLMRAF